MEPGIRAAAGNSGHHATVRPSRLTASTRTARAAILPSFASAECYEWPLREGKGGRLAYDADTIYITMPGLPPSIGKMSVRVNGIDAPEIRGKCGSEKTLAKTARDFVNGLLRSARKIIFCEPRWGKYAGRVLADVYVNGNRLADTLIEKGLGREYGGGRRRGWCAAD